MIQGETTNPPEVDYEIGVFELKRYPGFLTSIITTINEGCKEIGVAFEDGRKMSFKELKILIEKCDDVVTQYMWEPKEQEEFYENLGKDFEKYLLDLIMEYKCVGVVYHEIDVIAPHKFTPNDVLLYPGSPEWLEEKLEINYAGDLRILGYIRITE